MPLDPQVAAFYGDSLNVLPDMSAVTVEGTRQAVDAFHNDKAQSPVVYAAQDKTIPCPWGEMPIRIYRPDALTGHGALLYFHGGGFVIHNIASRRRQPQRRGGPTTPSAASSATTPESWSST